MEENMKLGDPTALLIRAKDAGRGSGFFVGKNLNCDEYSRRGSGDIDFR